MSKINLQPGMIFQSYQEVAEFMLNYQEQENKKLSKTNTRSLPGNDVIKYHLLSYQCVYAGVYKTRGNNVRQPKPSMKCGCPMVVKLIRSKDEKSLVVTDKSCFCYSKECDEKQPKKCKN